jgi:thiosulfate reductase cytochrome b subunit
MVMLRRIFVSLAVIALLGLASGALAARPENLNIMHPTFVPLDGSGQPVFDTGSPVDAEKTCGACHDVKFINTHDLHRSSDVKATCIECHFADGHMNLDANSFDEIGFLRKDRVFVHEPTVENCGVCHGIATDSPAPLGIPEDFENYPSYDHPYRDYRFTRLGGAIFSPQTISDSFLNISGKDSLNFPWDVHAAKVLSCTACHFAPNNPVRAAKKDNLPKHLTNDPRRLSLTNYLRTPDHRFATADCTSCHDPMQTHDCLPYKARHLEKIQCSACHASTRFAPTVLAVDETVVRIGGGPRIEYQNIERTDDESLNTALTHGYAPPLFPIEDASGIEKITPKNIYTVWSWIDQSGAEVKPGIVGKAYLDSGQYHSDVLGLFDKDGNGRLSDGELRLDSSEKVELIRSRLLALGVAQPKIDGRVKAWPIAHGIMSGKSLSISCADCHTETSRLRSTITLASFAPGGVMPQLDTDDELKTSLLLEVREADGAIELAREPGEQGFYILGHSRNNMVERLGFMLFVATFFGAAVHGFLRFWSGKKHKAPHEPVKKVYLYSAYERALHWLISISVIILIATGMRIHYAGGCRALLNMTQAVAVHNAFAVLLTISAFLFLFYHLASAAISQFIPPTQGLRSELMRQVAYYLRGIFKGMPHPLHKSPERKLNALQQITYLLLLNILLPVQILTGILIWGISRWPQLAEKIGGLSTVVPVHHMGSWLFLSFFIVHLYLTTTGHTVFSNIRAMIDGYDLIKDDTITASEEAHEKDAKGS